MLSEACLDSRRRSVEDLIKLLDIKHILVCSFVSWGVVQAIKPICKNRLPKHISDAVLRLAAFIIGGWGGFGMESTAHGAGIGAACGAMSAFTVALIKRMVSSKAKVDIKELEDGSGKEDTKEGA